MRASAWALTVLPRVAACGRATTGAGGVGVRLTAGAAGYSGLQSCGSVWADPVCSSKILARRAVEIGAALSQGQALGHGLGFVTLTMRHRRGQSLDELWSAAGKAWQRAISGKAWEAAQRRCGVVGWVRVWEVTTGRNGWHVHVHAVVVFDQGGSVDRLDQVASGMFGRWSRGLEAAGLDAPLRRGQEWHLVAGDDGGQSVAEYLAKLGRSAAGGAALGLELTHVRPGRSRSALATAPVWSLLDQAADGEAAAIHGWHEWERASKGRRQVGWSKGLRALLALPEVERSDDELAAEELGTAADTLVVITPAGWSSLVRTPHRLPLVLDAAEVGGLSGLRSLLDSWADVSYVVPVDS